MSIWQLMTHAQSLGDLVKHYPSLHRFVGLGFELDDAKHHVCGEDGVVTCLAIANQRQRLSVNLETGEIS